MRWEPIKKTAAERASANLTDYQRTRCEFRWARSHDWLSGLPGGGLNIGYEAVDRHALGPRGDRVALRCIDRLGTTAEVTYRQLLQRTNRFANALRSRGVERDDRVFSLLPRGLELYVTALGTLRNTSVYSPLSPALGPGPIRECITRGEGLLLVSTPELYARMIAPIRDELPSLKHILVTGDGTPPCGTEGLDAALDSATDQFQVPPTAPQDKALVHFTSGVTGQPKGTVQVHEAVAAHTATARFALDLGPNDVFWCTADPGRVTSTSYGIIAPLALGATVVVDIADFEAQRWYANLALQRVTNWYTAPTALRTLMRHGSNLPAEYDLSALRFVASAGEPLAPEVIMWVRHALGHCVHDNWWQAETGAIMISNFAAVDVRPGSMGLPVPGVTAALLRRGGDGRAAVVDGAVRVIDEPDTVGELALRSGWPSMFRGYLHDDDRYAERFAAGWYLSGELARRDADGYYWLVGHGNASPAGAASARVDGHHGAAAVMEHSLGH